MSAMDEKTLEKMLEITERFFRTANDPNQMPISKKSFCKLLELHPKTVIYKIENGEPISWVVVLPTSDELAEKFLKGEINERELLDMTQPQEQYEALYLCAAFTVPEHRRRGYVIRMLEEAIDSIPHTANVKLFSWPYSKEGRLVVEKLSKVMGVDILLKEN
ncbi:MAG: hypothetical protein ACUBOA_11735 [Candidatus Loosdrechtia sp.]|uniref:hypothetical protein n=1 Tax=Candidatus Loosdrechtia sp. TaxID=3101272 RepID=UPI003A63C88F|nr:MAG: hypothetical protein QY305_00540 [Candidatus Jettenia sp. AMX2]